MKFLVRNQSMPAEGIRFLLFGVFNTVVTYAAYCVLVFALHPQIAYAIIFALGIALAYIGNAHFVFQTAFDWKIARVYPLVYLVQYALTAVLIHLFGLWLYLGPRFALALALVVTVPVSFFLNRILLSRAPHRQGVQ